MVTSKPVLVRFLRIAPFSAVPSGFALLSGAGHFLEFPLVPSCLLGWVSVSREVYTLSLYIAGQRKGPQGGSSVPQNHREMSLVFSAAFLLRYLPIYSQQKSPEEQQKAAGLWLGSHNEISTVSQYWEDRTLGSGSANEKGSLKYPQAGRWNPSGKGESEEWTGL